jgi:hypothetical protein
MWTFLILGTLGLFVLYMAYVVIIITSSNVKLNIIVNILTEMDEKLDKRHRIEPVSAYNNYPISQKK